MKVSDNMLRVISYAYTNYTPTHFLVKTDIIQLNDDNISIKAIEIADMVNKLVKYTTTRSEKAFYAYTISAENYNKSLSKERSVDPGAATIKEFIIGNGLVYSEILEYMYNSLVKCEPTVPNLELLTYSIDKTHSLLTKMVRLKGEETQQFNITDIQAELKRLESKVVAIQKNVTIVTTHTEEINKTMLDMNENLDNTLASIQIDTVNSITNDITPNLTSFYQDVQENVKKQVKYTIEDQVSKISKGVIEQIESVDTKELQCNIAHTVKNEMKFLLDTIGRRLDDDIRRIDIATSTDQSVDYILSVINNLINKADNISEDPNLIRILDSLHRLSAAMDTIKTNNQAYTDLMDAALDNMAPYNNSYNNEQR